MISGSIAGLGTSYAIILHATNCATGETLAREQVEAKEKEQVPWPSVWLQRDAHEAR